jgi:hypothetical protein
MTKNKIRETTSQLCNTINKAGLSTKEIMAVVPEFLFSVGASLEKCDLQSSEEVLKRYTTKPSYGNALMAQALWMKETWDTSQEKGKTENDREL